LGQGLFGQADLAGNVWGLNVDGYTDCTATCNNCAYIDPRGPDYTLPARRGAAYDDSVSDLSSASRSNYVPSWNSEQNGGALREDPVTDLPRTRAFGQTSRAYARDRAPPLQLERPRHCDASTRSAVPYKRGQRGARHRASKAVRASRCSKRRGAARRCPYRKVPFAFDVPLRTAMPNGLAAVMAVRIASTLDEDVTPGNVAWLNA
jgi:hypothetical protein